MLNIFYIYILLGGLCTEYNFTFKYSKIAPTFLIYPPSISLNRRSRYYNTQPPPRIGVHDYWRQWLVRINNIR